MNGYSEDLQGRILSAVRRGMSKAQVARTFSVSISSVKRYVKKPERGESLAPNKRPGDPLRSSRKLLEEDLEERPFASLQERCEYIGAITGISVSRSTMWSAIARVGPTRKKGASRHRGRRVLEGGLAGDGGRDEIVPERLLFVEECALGIPPWRRSTATRRGASAFIFRCPPRGARTPRRSSRA